MSESSSPLSPSSPLREVLLLFGRMGLTAFGGPAAHIAVLERECVERRGWLSREEFVELLAVTNLLPGPNSTEMVMHLGYRRAGRAGLVAAGLAFILPAAGLTLLCAWLYVSAVDFLPGAKAAFRGVTPVMLVVIAEAVRRLAESALSQRRGQLLALAAGVAALAGVPELTVLLIAGLIGAVSAESRATTLLPMGLRELRELPGLGGLPAAASAAVGEPSRLGPMTLAMLKIGATLFGSGYLLVGYLRSDFVLTGWLSEQQLLDAVAVGQFTPGPLLTTATFVGFLLGGVVGAALATAAIFLPAFLAVAAVSGRMDRLRQSTIWAGVLAAVSPAVVRLMAVAALQLSAATLLPGGRPDGLAWAIFGVSAWLIIARQHDSLWLLAPAAIVGWLGYHG